MEQLKGLIPSSDSIISSKFSEKKEKIHYFHNIQGKNNPQIQEFTRSLMSKTSYRQKENYATMRPFCLKLNNLCLFINSKSTVLQEQKNLHGCLAKFWESWP
jgi:hypothetical protein